MPVTPDQKVRFTEPEEQPFPEVLAKRCGVAPNAALDVTSVAVMLVAATATKTFRNLAPRVINGPCPEDLSCREKRIMILSASLFLVLLREALFLEISITVGSFTRLPLKLFHPTTGLASTPPCSRD
jgi:hypothetical protein